MSLKFPATIHWSLSGWASISCSLIHFSAFLTETLQQFLQTVKMDCASPWYYAITFSHVIILFIILWYVTTHGIPNKNIVVLFYFPLGFCPSCKFMHQNICFTEEPKVDFIQTPFHLKCCYGKSSFHSHPPLKKPQQDLLSPEVSAWTKALDS